jgi:hypothetical protein
MSTAEATQPTMETKQHLVIHFCISLAFLVLAVVGVVWSFTSGLIGGGIDGILLVTVCLIVMLAFAMELLFLAQDMGMIKLPTFAPAKPAARAAAPAAKPAAAAGATPATAKTATPAGTATAGAKAPATTATAAPGAKPADAPATAPPAAVAKPQQPPATAPAAPVKRAPAAASSPNPSNEPEK